MSKNKRLVYLDSGVLIAAARGHSELAEIALSVLGNDELEFASSILVKLELTPKAHYNGRLDEVSFYDAYYARVSTWVKIDDTITQKALEEAM